MVSGVERIEAPLGAMEGNFELHDDLVTALLEKISKSSLDDRNALRNVNSDADEHQQRIIGATEESIRLIAPAGSGKTQTMVNRLLNEVRVGTRPEAVLVLTFDNSAATSLKQKLSTSLSGTGIDPNRFKISTLNAFGYAVLRKSFPFEYKGIIDRQRSTRLFLEARKTLSQQHPQYVAALPDDLDNRFYLDFFGYLKNQSFDPRAYDAQELVNFILKAKPAEVLFRPNSSKALIKIILQVVLRLFSSQELLYQRERLMDFDDQKLRALKCLRASPGDLDAVQSQYVEVMVDEFQDINRLDFELITDVARKARLVVTGDDDQAIYGFRGCTPEYIIKFSELSGRSAASYELSTNYRCPPNIVEHADRLIRHNVLRIAKTPVANRKDQATIKVVSSNSSAVEARMIIGFIRRVLSKNEKLKFSDVAVLYRTNAQSLPLQIHFILNNIPYYVREEDNIVTNDVLARLLSVLKVKHMIALGQQVDPHDATNTVKAFFRYVTEHQAIAIERYFRGNPNYTEAITSSSFSALTSKLSGGQFSEQMLEILKAKSLLIALDVVAKNFKGIRGMIGSLEDAVEERMPLGEVYELAASFRGRLKEFVETLDKALLQARSQNTGSDKTGGVAMLTYFKAKGLQWHTVILTSCNEGLIPHKKAPTEDERRLFYVALTRASSNLLISFLKKACNSPVSPSRFLNEAGLL